MFYDQDGDELSYYVEFLDRSGKYHPLNTSDVFWLKYDFERKIGKFKIIYLKII
jgi:hypothetical protein